MRRHLTLLCLLLAYRAEAVVVRGRVTSTLGVPLAGARIQLILGPRSVADAISGVDGSYEIRTALAGRFVLLTSASIVSKIPAVQVSEPFYGGRADVISLDVALKTRFLTRQTTTLPTARETNLDQVSQSIVQVARQQLLAETTLVPPLRTTEGGFLVQYGQTGNPANLYVRGAELRKVLVDGISAEDLGGRYNFGTVSTSGLSAPELSPALELDSMPGPVYGVDSVSGAFGISVPRGENARPTLVYTGDGGSLGSYRNEAAVSAARGRLDALASFGRFDTRNDQGYDPFHTATSSANVGYHISGGTSLRFLFRDEVSASGLASPFDLFGVEPRGRQGDQNLYSSLLFSTVTQKGWHNAVRVGVVRKRGEIFNDQTLSIGIPVTIIGANGYVATGQASFLPLAPREDKITNRDEYSYETDRPLARGQKFDLAGLFDARYQDERAADLVRNRPRQTLERRHVSAALGFQGEALHRLFFEAAGSIDDSPTYGLTGSPRLGLTYVPVRPGTRRLQGTTLRATMTTGVRELSLREDVTIGSVVPPRSRAFEVGAEQSLLGEKLVARATYFHNQFSHETELMSLSPQPVFVQGLAFRTQGLTADARYQPLPRVSLHGSYTYLAALVERSSTSPVFNPNIPGVAIGAFTALGGSRPFHTPPQTGFVAVEYAGNLLAATFRASIAGRSDDSTLLSQTPTLLLPNRNVSPGFASLDANISFAVTRRINAFTQLTNLLNDRHMAPIGYVSSPFLVRAGLRIRLGRD